MPEKKGGIAKKVRDAVEAAVNEAGYRIWDVEYYKEGSEMILEISIDRDGGISIDDCSKVTKLIEPMIDALDPIEEHYCLQVSSAGMVRNLTRDEHIRFALDNGLEVSLGLFAPVDGTKEYSGTITGFDGNTVTLDSGHGIFSFDKKQITKINAEFASGEEEPETDENKENNNEQGSV